MKLFLFCFAMLLKFNLATTLKRESLLSKQRKLGGGFEDMLE